MNWLSNLINKPPSNDDFAKVVMAYLNNLGTFAKTRYDKAEFAVECLDNNDKIVRTVYLTNIFADYSRAQGAERDKVLNAYLATTVAMPASLEEARSQLLPRIQPRIFYESTKLSSKINMASKHAQEIADIKYEVFAEHYGIALVVDTPTQIMYISAKTLSEWGTAYDDCLSIALTNLAKITPEPLQQLRPGFIVCQYRDSHGASRIALDKQFEASKFNGRPVAFVPNRDTLIITGENDEDGIAEALKIVQEAMQEPRAMPVYPILFDGDKWRPWQVPAEHPKRMQLNDLAILAKNSAYEAQKPLLEKQLQVEKEDKFVATYMVISKDGQQNFASTSSWLEGITSLLPETDNIMLMESKMGIPSPYCMAPFSKVQEIMRNEMKLLSVYPPRYEVTTFPTAEQRARIKEFAVSVN